VRVLLVATYELGHQPLSLATAAGALRAVGHEVDVCDTSVEPPEHLEERALRAEWVLFSVPMHTATQLAVETADALRRRLPGLRFGCFGLYAPVAATAFPFDLAIAGEFEAALVEGLASLEAAPAGPAESPAVVARTGPTGGSTTAPAPTAPAGHEAGAVKVALERDPHRTTDRRGLPPLPRYAHLEIGPERRTVGYLEATRGCRHRCRHCPVPVVYGGRVRPVDLDDLLTDAEQLVRAGATHLTFGDPDFLNRPAHAERVVAAVHAAFPSVSFDCTVKVEHVVRYADVWPRFAEAGCLFVTSALESMDDDVLALLDKGHTAADAHRAVRILAAAGIDLHPSWLPFTPWTSRTSLVELLAFVAREGLVPTTDTVQYSIRLLVPPGSLLLQSGLLSPFLDGYDPSALSWRWHGSDPALDDLQATLAELAAEGARCKVAPEDAWPEVTEAVGRVTGTDDRWRLEARTAPRRDRPRLSEPWFCCAEPTRDQRAALQPH